MIKMHLIPLLLLGASVIPLPLNAGPEINQSGPAQHSQRESAMQIELIIGEQKIPATLDKSPAVDDFIALLPITLRLEDYHRTEKIADLPEKLSREGSPPRI